MLPDIFNGVKLDRKARDTIRRSVEEAEKAGNSHATIESLMVAIMRNRDYERLCKNLGIDIEVLRGWVGNVRPHHSENFVTDPNGLLDGQVSQIISDAAVHAIRSGSGKMSIHHLAVRISREQVLNDILTLACTANRVSSIRGRTFDSPRAKRLVCLEQFAQSRIPKSPELLKTG